MKELLEETTSPRQGWGAPRSRSVTWYDPTLLAAAAAELSGRDFLQAIIDGRLPPPPIATLHGAELVSVGEGEAVFRSTPDESTYNPIGMVHGGMLCTLLDSAAGCAAHTLLPAGTGYASIEIKVSFLRPLRAGAGAIEAHGRVLRIGKRVAFAEAHARDADGLLVGHATTSIAVVRARRLALGPTPSAGLGLAGDRAPREGPHQDHPCEECDGHHPEADHAVP